jgi:DNA-binding response OmpR family regulator
VCTILISTQSSEKDRARGLALGANAFLAKPFTVEALHQTIMVNIGAPTAARVSLLDVPEATANREESLS